jgi:hypothetical protein
MAKMGGIIRQLKKEQDQLTRQLKGIAAALAAFGGAYGKGTGRRRISVAGRARIAAAQPARWAKVRATGNSSKSRTPKKRTSTRASHKKNRRPANTTVKRSAATTTEWRRGVVDSKAETIKNIAKDVYRTLGSGFAWEWLQSKSLPTPSAFSFNAPNKTVISAITKTLQRPNIP